MRTELELEQLGQASSAPRRPARQQRRRSLLWLVAAAAVVLLLVIAYFLFSSNEPKPVVAAGASSRSIAISQDGSRLAVGLLDGSLRILNARNGKTIAIDRSDDPKQPLAAVSAVAFGPGDSVLVLRANQSRLHIFNSDLKVHTERTLHPNPHDLVWSRALDAALVLTGGSDELQAKIEVFPAHPMGIQRSTSQLLNLITWSKPKCIAVSQDGSRVAISYASKRKLNLLVYDPRARRNTAALLTAGEPEGVALASDGMHLWAASPTAETVSEAAPFSLTAIQLPKLASTSPPKMIAVNEASRRAYTTGSLTFPEINLDQRRITRTVELPERSAGIVLTPDRSTAYLTFEKLDIVGIVDLKAMRWVGEIQFR